MATIGLTHANIQKAIKETSLIETAHRLNLKPYVLKHYINFYTETGYVPPVKEVATNIIQEIIDMVERDFLLSEALAMAKEKYDIDISNAVFWRSAKKIDPKYTTI